MICPRYDKLHSYSAHPWFSRYYNKLSTTDLKIINNFLYENRALGKDAFEKKVVRMFLDNPDRPRRWSIIIELLANANS